MKRYLLIPLLSLLSFSCASCNKVDPLIVKFDELTRANVNDKYRNFYQIFPISFADSDKNGKGDLKGIIDKLDYIDEMGYNGIWLNPVHKSATCHHYDVEDYFSVSTQFGTMERFDELVSKCHE